MYSGANKISLTLTFILLTVGVAIHGGGQTPSETVDKYQWLEDVSGDRSMAWVRAENERSSKILENDPRFAGLAATALALSGYLRSPDLFRAGALRSQHPEEDLPLAYARGSVGSGFRFTSL